MNSFYLIGILTFSVYSVESVGFHGFFYEGMKEPEPSEWNKINLVKYRWIVQPVDHFHIQDHRTWRMVKQLYFYFYLKYVSTNIRNYIINF